MGSSAPHAATTAVLPTPVGPTSTGVRGGVSGSPKSPLQLALGQLYDRGSPVHVVSRQRRAEQADHELAHLLSVEPLARLDGRATGERRCKRSSRLASAPNRPPARSATSSWRQRAASNRGWGLGAVCTTTLRPEDRKSTRLNSS